MKKGFFLIFLLHPQPSVGPAHLCHKVFSSCSYFPTPHKVAYSYCLLLSAISMMGPWAFSVLLLCFQWWIPAVCLTLHAKAFSVLLPFHGKALCFVWLGNFGRSKFFTSPPIMEDFCFTSCRFLGLSRFSNPVPAADSLYCYISTSSSVVESMLLECGRLGDFLSLFQWQQVFVWDHEVECFLFFP